MEFHIPETLQMAMVTYVGGVEKCPVAIALTIRKYKGEHGVVPVQWSMFLKELHSKIESLVLHEISKEDFMKNVFKLEAKRTKWISEIINSGADYTSEELHELSLVELRDIRDKVCPTFVVEVQGTSSGKIVKFTELKVA